MGCEPIVHGRKTVKALQRPEVTQIIALMAKQVYFDRLPLSGRPRYHGRTVQYRRPKPPAAETVPHSLALNASQAHPGPSAAEPHCKLIRQVHSAAVCTSSRISMFPVSLRQTQFTRGTV